mgnify:CR=1 FL=1
MLTTSVYYQVSSRLSIGIFAFICFRLIALKKLGVKPNEAIFIGDSRYDIQCAHNAGVEAVLVDWTICLPKKERFGENRAEYEIKTAEELLELLK